jgi:DNA-binding NarL/FixJ family response regulator
VGSIESDREETALTAAEARVLELAGKGMTNAEIAERLFVVETTVKFHLSRIYKKLGVRNRTEAALWASRVRIRH